MGISAEALLREKCYLSKLRALMYLLKDIKRPIGQQLLGIYYALEAEVQHLMGTMEGYCEYEGYITKRSQHLISTMEWYWKTKEISLLRLIPWKFTEYIVKKNFKYLKSMKELFGCQIY